MNSLTLLLLLLCLSRGLHQFPEMLNMQTHMFCGYGPECDPSSSASHLWSMANAAADRLETEYALVGILEQLPESLRAFQVGPNSCRPPIGSSYSYASALPEGCKYGASSSEQLR